MNFREFYEQETLKEFSDASRDRSVDKVGAGAGGLVGGISKLFSGAMKKAWSFVPWSKTLKDMAEKGDKAITIAKIIYPYPEENVKYDNLKKEGKHKDAKMVSSFLTQTKMDGTILTPLGLVIVYKTYNAVSQLIKQYDKGKLKNTNTKVSMQSLLEAAKKENVRFPKFKNLKELVKAFTSSEVSEGSQWKRWTQTATMYSAWKHLYDKVDTESETSIVSDLSGYPSKKIQEAIDNLEEQKIEVNSQNIIKILDKDLDDAIELIKVKLEEGTATHIESSKINADDSDIRTFLKSRYIKPFAHPKNDLMLANIYSTTHALLATNNLSSQTIGSVFSTYDSFITLFKGVKNFDKANLSAKSTGIKEFLANYIAMNDQGVGANKEKMKQEYIQKPPKKLYDFIYANTSLNKKP